jgi:hypothetical protein
MMGTLLAFIPTTPAAAQDGEIPESSLFEAWKWAVQTFTPAPKPEERESVAPPALPDVPAVETSVREGLNKSSGSSTPEKPWRTD